MKPVLMPHVAEAYPEQGELLKQAIADPQIDEPVRVIQLFHMVSLANRLADGEYGEFGVHKGIMLKVIHRFMDKSRTLFGFDTFEGFDKRDIETENYLYRTKWTEGNFSPTSVDQVAAYVGDGTAPDNLTLIKGWFPESFLGHSRRKWRFVHIDFDLYQPIATALDILWGQVVPGGVVMVHDYGCYGFPGVRLAVDEFCESVEVMPIELADQYGTAVFRKPMP